MEHLIEFLYKLLRFLPRFKTINPNEGAVIIRFGRYIKTLGGEHYRFFWPVITEIIVIPTKKDTIDLANQTITLEGGKTAVINGSVRYEIRNVKTAILENLDVDKNFQEDAADAFTQAISAASTLDIEEIKEDVTNNLSESMKLYGIKVKSVNIGDFVRDAVPVRNIGN